MKNYMVKPAAIVFMLVACGCTTERAELHSETNPYLSQGRIQFESSTTKNIVRVVQVDTERLQSGLLKVFVTLRNTKKENLWADIRTTFLDSKGHVLEQTNWEPVLLSARTVSEYTCTSLGKQAADYQIIIRKPKKTALDMP